MAGVSTYLNFSGTCLEAFEFYKSVFGGDFAAHMPSQDDATRVMHIALPILGGHMLMGSDVPEKMGPVVVGTNVYVALTVDSNAEADRLFAGLEAGGTVEQKLQQQFWGDYWGCLKDKYGVQWMLTGREAK